MMKILVERVTDRYNEIDKKTYKEFWTIEDLMNYVDGINEDIIIRRCLDGSKKIVIYDDFVE